MNRFSSRTSWVPWLAGALVVRVLTTLVARELGFHAISDDDFARVSIAQRFAHEPRWDASGTSWLPAPFWLTGSVMWALGTRYAIATAVAWFTSLGSVAIFVWCGRAMGLRGAWLGLIGLGFAAMPHAVWLGSATVPEGYVAVLTVFGLLTVSSNAPRRWAYVGALALLVATLSRYETWPPALVAAAYHGYAAWRRKQRWRLAPLFVCLTGPVAWMVSGVVHHGSALFFVARVSNYRAALGATPEGWLDVLGNYPLALVCSEPVVTLLVLAALTMALLTACSPAPSTPFSADLRRDANSASAAAGSYAPLVGGAICVFVFLIWGDVTNGAPTHHPERTLLPCWLAALLVSASALSRRLGAMSGAVTTSVCGVCVVAFGVGVWALLPHKEFVDRSQELSLGETLATRLGPDARLWLETPGYGYIAVGVGTGQPWLVDGYNPDDPRQRDEAPPFDDARALSASLRARRVGYAVVPAHRAAAFESWANQDGHFGSSLIFRIPTSVAVENSEPAAD